MHAGIATGDGGIAGDGEDTAVVDGRAVVDAVREFVADRSPKYARV
jgi:hypothetical protein